MLNCSIYVTGNVTENELITKFCDFLNAESNAISFITTDNYELSIDENDEFDEDKQRNFPDGFLYFKYIVLIEFNERNSSEYCIGEVGRILSWLWKNGLTAVASCDYENLLPENGGYKSENIPWVG